MNPASASRSGGRESPASAKEVDTKGRKTTPNAPPKTTPSSDMQPDDAGTGASGNAERGTAAQGAMKQEQKTQNESGSSR